MENGMTQTSRHFPGKILLILMAVFLFMLLLNILLPIRGDDFLYSMIWETPQHIASFGDVCLSMYRHYLMHGGRMVTVFFLDLFLWLGKIWFDIANAAVFTAVLVLLYCHSTRSVHLTKEPGILALGALFMWLCLPHFGEVAVWKSGSTVYLWSGLFAFLFLLPYNLFLAGRVYWGAGMAAPMFLLGVLGGWSVENLAVTVVLLAAGISWRTWKRGALPIWIPAGAAGALIGFIGLLAAPGNWNRYDQQGRGEGLLRHVGNQLAGNGEMILYLIPLILLLLLLWRILKAHLLERRGESLPRAAGPFSLWQALPLALILVLAASYFSGGAISALLRDSIIAGVLVPLHLDKPHTVYQISHVMEGFEEMAVYWAGVFFVYFQARRVLGFSGAFIRSLNRKITARDVWRAYPAVRYAGFLIALCFVNNFFMLAAPTFPARAAFSSSLMVMAAALALLRMPEVQAALSGGAGRILCAGGAAIALFIAAAAVTISWAITRENDWRIAYIAERAGSGAVVELPPIEIKNRALRHVFYKEFELGRDRDYMMNRYYGIKDVKLIEK